MATKKDLVEAYSFSRRRLVTAFVSGAPGGREVEPARPGRMIVGGVALAILLVAGAAIAGTLSQRAEVDWKKPGLVSDERGALYVILDQDLVPGEPTIRPVINVTSAQLILGADIKARKVPDKEIASQPKGPPIGILDAPATVPLADQLVNSRWTACTGTGLGVRAAVRERPGVTTTPDQGFVVTGATSKKTYLIAEAEVPGHPRRAYRYLLPDLDSGPLTTALNVQPGNEIEVPDAWLELFPPGGALDAEGLGVTGLGEDAGLPSFPGAAVGDVFTKSGASYVITKAGPAELTEFAAGVLAGTRQPAVVTPKDGVGYRVVPDSPYADASWPTDLISGSPGATQQVCAELVTAKGEQPAVVLATDPEGAVAADDVVPGAQEADVESGRGALVRSADWNTSADGTLHLIDDRGYSYQVAGRDELGKLGYDKVPAVVVPDVWNKLFEDGPELSIDAALCPPSRTRTCGT
ncbi:type VII secretion protein EccB [Pimelobacter sp. 30-1]|uniref:type VII secretion protein EccB n=1 Tax=Pimelobacter sp. 30-1 TaxID=2004991 RepID=UPI001C058009|nr:type VII secretion protein EccB [Pimelobacter sp. 30-1]MBU2693939.1 type VII secretion protein EccB [Pimelobacter sp. 30-1]